VTTRLNLSSLPSNQESAKEPKRNSSVDLLDDEYKEADAELRAKFPAYGIVGQYLVDFLIRELRAGTNFDVEGIEYESSSHIITAFRMQLINYSCQRHPFNLYLNLAPRDYWKKLRPNAEANVLAVSCLECVCCVVFLYTLFMLRYLLSNYFLSSQTRWLKRERFRDSPSLMQRIEHHKNRQHSLQ
jgi:hypothetical protein